MTQTDTPIPTIEAGPTELEALRSAIRPFAHLERCEPVVAAARNGRIPADDFVLERVRGARDRLAGAMFEYRFKWPPSSIAHTSRRLATLEGLLHQLEAVRN